jgi:hypothetical protein
MIFHFECIIFQEFIYFEKVLYFVNLFVLNSNNFQKSLCKIYYVLIIFQYKYMDFFFFAFKNIMHLSRIQDYSRLQVLRQVLEDLHLTSCSHSAYFLACIK